LGVQKGMVRWFLSLHSPLHSYSISPEKVGGSATPKKIKKAKTDPQEAGELPSKDDADLNDAGTSSVSPGTSGSAMEFNPTILAFTPSIKNTLDKSAVTPGRKPIPLPSGIDVAHLKGRLNGKNKVK
jgi:DNA-3-methyladenine glycosylase II